MKTLLEELKKLPVILVGLAIYSFGVAGFLLPNGLIVGGTTGLALAAEHYFGIPVVVFVACFNVFAFLLGLAFLGWGFALSTLVSTFAYPALLSIMQRIPAVQSLTRDKLLACIFSGLLLGLGLGIVLRAGASTGGMDIPPLILNKRTGLPVAGFMYGFDTVILLLQVSFSTGERVLYGILVVLLTSLVINQVMLVGQGQTQVLIISDLYAKINEGIQRELDRGSTLLSAVSGHLGKEQKLVLAVISRRELAALNRLVLGIDPKAFMVISQVNEVKGRGFTLQKNQA